MGLRDPFLLQKKFIKSVWKKLGCYYTSFKGNAVRIQDKINEYEEEGKKPGWPHVGDLCRGKVVVHSIPEVIAAYNAIYTAASFKIIKVKPKMYDMKADKPHPLCNITMNITIVDFIIGEI